MALALRKDDPQFLEAVNKALDELKESGTLAELEKKWMEE
jgi:ABC-type amino acid transport substrate-binding protein